MTNWFMAIYNLDDKEKLNTPRKIAFRQTNLIKIIIGKFTDKTSKNFFYIFFFFFFFDPLTSTSNPIYRDLLTLVRAHDVT